MEKIIPYEGSELRRYDHFRSPLFNLIVTGLDRDDYAYYIVTPWGYAEVDERLIAMLHSQEKELIETEDKKYKLKGEMWEGMIYIISGEPLFKYLPTPHIHKLSSILKSNTYPRISTVPSYKGKKWTVRVNTYYKIDSPKPSVNGSFIAHYLREHAGGEFTVSGDTSTELVTNLREELADHRKEVGVSPSKLSTAIKTFYEDPNKVWFAFNKEYDMKQLPTEKRLIKDIDDTKRAIETVHKSSYNISNIKLFIEVPPIDIEKYRRFMMHVETSLCPAFRDRQYVLVKRDAKTDPLFDKVCEHIGKLPAIYETRGKERYKTSYIRTTYADYMDMGEIFSLGEAHELSRRLRPIE